MSEWLSGHSSAVEMVSRECCRPRCDQLAEIAAARRNHQLSVREAVVVRSVFLGQRLDVILQTARSLVAQFNVILGAHCSHFGFDC